MLAVVSSSSAVLRLTALTTALPTCPMRSRLGLCSCYPCAWSTFVRSAWLFMSPTKRLPWPSYQNQHLPSWPRDFLDCNGFLQSSASMEAGGTFEKGRDQGAWGGPCSRCRWGRFSPWMITSHHFPSLLEMPRREVTVGYVPNSWLKESWALNHNQVAADPHGTVVQVGGTPLPYDTGHHHCGW